MVAASVLEDQTAQVDEVIQENIASQIAKFENYGFLYRDGITQPKAILKYEITTSNYDPKSKTLEGIKVEAEFNDYTKLVDLMDLLPSKYFYGASWLMSRIAASKLRYMKDNNSVNFFGKYQFYPALQTHCSATL